MTIDPDHLRTRLYRYIPHSQVQSYYEAGWNWAADLGPTHGEWGGLMHWPHDGDPVEPGKARDGA